MGNMRHKICKLKHIVDPVKEKADDIARSYNVKQEDLYKELGLFTLLLPEECLKQIGKHARHKLKKKTVAKYVVAMRDAEMLVFSMDSASLSYHAISLIREVYPGLVPCTNILLSVAKDMLADTTALLPIQRTVRSKPGNLTIFIAATFGQNLNSFLCTVADLWAQGFCFPVKPLVLALSLGMNAWWMATAGGKDESLKGVIGRIEEQCTTAPTPQWFINGEFPLVICGDAFNPSGRPGAACTAIVFRPCAPGYEPLFHKPSHYLLCGAYKGEIPTLNHKRKS